MNSAAAIAARRASVHRMTLRGMSVKRIAADLMVTVRTVESDRAANGHRRKHSPSTHTVRVTEDAKARAGLLVDAFCDTYQATTVRAMLGLDQKETSR